MHYNNFRCGHQNCMRARDGKQLYYKSWPKPLGMSPELWSWKFWSPGPKFSAKFQWPGSGERETELDALNKEMPDWKEWEQLGIGDWQLRLLNKSKWRQTGETERSLAGEIGSWDCWTKRCQTGETERSSAEEIGSWDCWTILHSLKDLVSPSRSSYPYPYKCAKLPMAYTVQTSANMKWTEWEVLNHELEHCRNQRCECSKLSLWITDTLYP